VPNTGAFFGLARLMVHRDLTLCQNGRELGQNGSQFRVTSGVIGAGPKGESPTNGHLLAQPSDDLSPSRGVNSVVARAGIDIHGFDLCALVAQALRSSLHALRERSRGLVALLRDDYPVVRAECVA
jgi:hypothetical protein